jgi:DNA-binding GntR family transcriptional regulator
VDETVRPRSAPEAGGTGVYQLLRSRLLNNEIAPGDRLNIDGLARDLAVSPTVVREALLRLEGDDLVVKSPHKGYRTTELLDSRELVGLFELRLLLEPWAARTVAGRELGRPARTLLSEVHRLVEDAEDAGVDRNRLMEHDMQFHDAIIAATGNRAVLRAFERTHCHLHLFRLCPPHTDGRETAREHETIAEAILRSRPDDAEQSMRDHLTASHERFARAAPDR